MEAKWLLNWLASEVASVLKSPGRWGSDVPLAEALRVFQSTVGWLLLFISVSKYLSFDLLTRQPILFLRILYSVHNSVVFVQRYDLSRQFLLSIWSLMSEVIHGTGSFLTRICFIGAWWFRIVVTTSLKKINLSSGEVKLLISSQGKRLRSSRKFDSLNFLKHRLVIVLDDFLDFLQFVVIIIGRWSVAARSSTLELVMGMSGDSIKTSRREERF